MLLRYTRMITCPRSAHLETIQYTNHADGYIANVEACTAFEPCGAVVCDQLCKKRMNRRRAAERDDAAAATRY